MVKLLIAPRLTGDAKSASADETAMGLALLELMERRHDEEEDGNSLRYFVLTAVIISHRLVLPLPDFVRSSMFELAWKTVVEVQDEEELVLGQAPSSTSKDNRRNDQWHRYADCHELFIAWYEGDAAAVAKAFAVQQRRASWDTQFVRDVEKRRVGPPRRSLDNVWSDLERESLERGGSKPAGEFKNRYKRLTAQRQPVVLVRKDDGYIIGRRDVRSGSMIPEQGPTVQENARKSVVEHRFRGLWENGDLERRVREMWENGDLERALTAGRS